jgi:type IV pilus assembly protein PilN
MIRINLLGKVKVKAASKPKARRGMPSQVLQLVMLICVAVLSVGSIFFWERALSQRDEQLTNETNRAKKEKARQENLLKENEVFEKRRKLLENRINIIEDLKNHQSGPVRILDTLSDCVQRTEGLWLRDFSQKDNLITLNGTVMGTPNVIADFITNLDQIGKFKNINLINATEENSKYSFSLTFEVPAEVKAETKPNT